jgi:RecA/RadA recombinase
MANMANENTALILISQIRNNISTSGPSYGYKPSGGKAMEHDPTTIISITSSHSDSQRIKGLVNNGKRMIEQPIGNDVKWELKKHRGSGDGMIGNYNFYYNGDFLGVDTISELVTEATKLGVIEKGGAWFVLDNGMKFQGQAKITKYLRENPDEYELIKKAVLDA